MAKTKTRKSSGAQPREGQASLQTRTTRGRSERKSSWTFPADSPEAGPSGSNVSPPEPQPSQVESSHSEMASMGGSHLNPDPLYRLVRGAPMLNKILTSICKAEGLAVGGVKLELQNRICENIKKYVATNDVARFERLKAMLEHPDQVNTLQANPRYGVYQNSPSGPAVAGVPNNYHNGGYQMAYRPGMNIQFKPSPFYTLLQQLGDTKLCEVMAEHRHTIGIQVKPMDYNILQNVQNDKTMRVMVFACEVDPGQVKHDIGFPYQSEIKVNGGEVKANLRGLKNRPGSTRPVDITDALRLRQIAYANNIEMTYALTQKKFYMMIYVVKTVPVTDLVKKLEAGKRISKEGVIKEMVTKAQDPDIVATSTVLSLKCPLSASRINLPCRSSSCQHIQCFDATSYMQLQEQGPTWSCPICSKPAPFDSLAVDEYVQDILSKTSRLVEQVTIEPDGTWLQHSKASSPKTNDTSFGSDDEELVEIKDSRVSALKMASTPVPSVGSARTPPMSSREASASAASTHASTSSKRPASQIIDLTLSDDDDDEPISRPKKRQFTGYSTPQSIPTARSATNGMMPHGMMNGRSNLNGS